MYNPAFIHAFGRSSIGMSLGGRGFGHCSEYTGPPQNRCEALLPWPDALLAGVRWPPICHNAERSDARGLRFESRLQHGFAHRDEGDRAAIAQWVPARA